MTITDVLTELKVPFAEGGQHRHVMTGFIGIDCNRCSPESGKMKLGIRISTLFTTCWSCGGVNLTSALTEASGRPFHRVKALLDSLNGGIPLVAPDRSNTGRLTLPFGVGELLPAHRKYLKGRNLNPDELSKVWGVQGIGVAPKLAWRVFIPVRHKDKTVSWTTRAISDKAGMRYASAKPEQEAMPIKSILFGSEHAKHAVVVTEGPLDAMRIGAGATATLGTGYSQAQLLAIAKFPVRTILFDGENEAQTRAAKLCRALEAFGGVTKRAVLDSAKDAAAASAKEIEQVRRCFL